MAGLARSTAERERDPVLEFVKKAGVDVVSPQPLNVVYVGTTVYPRHRESVRKGGWYERDIEANRRVRC
jgi:hypothetical protein